MSKKSPAKQPNEQPLSLTDIRDEMIEKREAPLPEKQPLSLSDIRNEVLKAHTHTAHTIADLEAWRAEIEATIAFLKARGR